MGIGIGTMVYHVAPTGRCITNTVRELVSIEGKPHALMEGGARLPLDVLQPVFIEITDTQAAGMDDMAEIWREVDRDKREEQREEAREEEDDES